jgi:hypothetical protein
MLAVSAGLLSGVVLLHFSIFNKPSRLDIRRHHVFLNDYT